MGSWGPHCRFETVEDGERRRVAQHCRHSYKHFAGRKPFTEIWNVLEEKLSANSVVRLAALPEGTTGDDAGNKPVVSLRFVVGPRADGVTERVSGLVEVQYDLEILLFGHGNIDTRLCAKQSAKVGVRSEGAESLISGFVGGKRFLG